jgi:hypothetical protein
MDVILLLITQMNLSGTETAVKQERFAAGCNDLTIIIPFT